MSADDDFARHGSIAGDVPPVTAIPAQAVRPPVDRPTVENMALLAATPRAAVSRFVALGRYPNVDGCAELNEVLASLARAGHHVVSVAWVPPNPASGCGFLVTSQPPPADALPPDEHDDLDIYTATAADLAAWAADGDMAAQDELVRRDDLEARRVLRPRPSITTRLRRAATRRWLVEQHHSLSLDREPGQVVKRCWTRAGADRWIARAGRPPRVLPASGTWEALTWTVVDRWGWKPCEPIECLPAQPVDLSACYEVDAQVGPWPGPGWYLPVGGSQWVRMFDPTQE